MCEKMLVAVVAVFPFFVAPQAAEREFELTKVEKAVIRRTNMYRAEHSLPPLVVDPQLMKAAREHADWMARSDNLTHTHRAVGENIAWNQATAYAAVDDWMTSPGHRANILSASYGRIGVAVVRASDGSPYWCQQFLDGRP
jgi:uncharacterized protein YkwD